MAQHNAGYSLRSAMRDTGREQPPRPQAVPVLGVPVFKLPEMVRRLLHSIDFPISELVIVENGPVDAESERMMRAFLKKLACGPPKHVTFDGDGAPAWRPESLQGVAKQCTSQTSLIWRTTKFSLERSEPARSKSNRDPVGAVASPPCAEPRRPRGQTWAARTRGTSCCATPGGCVRHTL